MKVHFHFNLLGFLVAALIFGLPMLSLSEVKDQISVKTDDKQKKYEVIETKRYEIVEIEESAESPEDMKSIEEQAVSDAKKDAAAHLNQTLWFSTGCFLPLIGPILSQWYQPFLPTARVLGKSPEYVAFYYDTYKVTTKKLQFTWALGGCLVGAPTTACLLILRYRD